MESALQSVLVAPTMVAKKLGRMARSSRYPRASLLTSVNAPVSLDALGVFVTPAVAQFLGVRSLVRFGATCKAHGEVVVKEVARRKERVASIEAEVQTLLGHQHDTYKSEDDSEEGEGGEMQPKSMNIPLRADVIAARELSAQAFRLIDDEIGFHKKLSIRELSIKRDPCERGYNWRDHDPFLNERKKFLIDVCGDLPSLLVLPDVFWFPAEGESTNPSQKEIEAMSKKATKVWGAESLMSGVYECGMDDPDWDRLNYEQPFRKFDLRGAVSFREFMLVTAGNVWESGNTMLDAFRIGARKQVYNSPGARDCLWYTLDKSKRGYGDDRVIRGKTWGERKKEAMRAMDLAHEITFARSS